MGTSLVMMGQLFEAARCYVRAFHLASEAQDLASQVELLESLGWTYTELGYAQRAIECMMLLCQLHEQLGEPEAVVSTLSALSSLHSAIGEADEAVACLERALADVQERMDRYAIHPPNPSVCVRYPVRHSLTHMHTRPRTSTDTHSSFDLRRRCRTTCSCVARS